jgi:predicted phage terminase large subunit-like protein
MATKLGEDFLRRVAGEREMVRDLRRAKTEVREGGKKIVFYKFIKEVKPEYKFYRFHAELIKQLQRVIDGDCKRLIIQTSPRHGKSEIASRLLPAAYLLAHPNRYVGLSSYSAELAEGFSGNAREYYKAAGGLLDPAKQGVNEWKTQGGGGLWAAGVGGSITGRSGHLLVIDDPIKGREEAESPRLMEKLWDWYTSTLYTRLEPKVGAIVVIQTRWSETDLIGKLLEQEMNVSEKGRENWTIIDWPAISEDADSRPPLPSHCEIVPDWREEPGDALVPQRYDIDELERIREAIGSRDFAALYQQRPAPVSGNLFNPAWWQEYGVEDPLPNFDRIMLSVDCTFTDASNSDYVVGMVVGQAGNRYYVLDMSRERTDIIGTINMISRMYNRHRLSGTIIELAASGYAAYQLMSKRVPGLIGFKPEKSKVARAMGIIPIVEAGNVFIPKSAAWMDSFMNEMNLFPGSKNDDIVDALTMAINYMAQRTMPMMTEVTWGRGTVLTGMPATMIGQ